ncbi:AAA family ATPase [Nocardia sp. NPDC006630]|uniref:ATP-binding protein n=1 Tax=Nocardia sp. NPDC006630 TaxID=3157181 RepID=UPI0033B53DCB
MPVGPGFRDTGAPMETGGLAGRERELERLTTLLSNSARMVTLIGPGGIGKTRLATAVARRIRKARRMPVYWVHLARLPRDAGHRPIEDAILAAVIDGDFSGRSAPQALRHTLGRSDAAGRAVRTLLVLDNCEHVLDGVGRVVAELLNAIPGLTVLATSRTAIGWVDEHIMPIPPLPRAQALALFEQGAERAGRPVAVGDQALAESICRHLHNYPLHIRLAAARLRYQPLPMILRDLDGAAADRRLRWSPGFRVGGDERHRDINAVIGWSFELCGPKERLLFERMSVFATGYDINPEDVDADGIAGPDIGADLDAIEAVCADTDTGGLARHEIESLLEQLADRSMVSIHLGADNVRYSLLESFQVFARARLQSTDDGEWLRLSGRHRRYYRDEIAAACTQWVSPREQDLLARARASWDNVQCAIESSLSDPDEAVIGLEIAAGLISLRIPFLRGSLRESRGLAERSLSAARALGRCSTELEISARALIGWLSLCQGMPGDAQKMLDDCVSACLEPAAPTNWRADPAADLGLPGAVEYLWGSVLMLSQGDPRAMVVLARARVKFTAAGDPGGTAMSELFESLAAAFYGTAEQALAVTGRHLDRVASSGAQWATSWGRYARAIALSEYADPNEAMALCDSALEWQIPMRDHWGGVWGLHIRAWILARMIDNHGSEQPVRQDRIEQWAMEIARLTGSTAALRWQSGIELTNLGPFADRSALAVEVAVNIVGHSAFEAAAREGERAGETVRMAAGGRAPVDSAAHPAVGTDSNNRNDPSEHWDALTAAEQDVAILIAAGLTNTAIAARRGTSNRTVDSQVAAILVKLEINSRKSILPLLPAEHRASLLRS